MGKHPSALFVVEVTMDPPIEIVNESCAVSSFVYEWLTDLYPDDHELLKKLWYEGDQLVSINTNLAYVSL